MNEYNVNQQKQNFNSIKVRLELVTGLTFKPTSVIFQFHKGAIRTKSTAVFSSSLSISIP